MTVLKGGVSYTEGEVEYIWHSTDRACEKCQELNNKVFNSIDEIPDRPHPNCRCWVEDRKKDEECNCIEELLDDIISELEEAKGNAQSLADEYDVLSSQMEDSQSHIEEMISDYENMKQEVEYETNEHSISCNNNLSEIQEEISEKINKLPTLIKTIAMLIELIKAQEKTVFYFATQYGALLYEAYALKRAGMDKYRHSVANCQGAQLGEFGEIAATMLSDLKELFDQWEDVYAKSHGVTLEEAKADSERDQVANKLGRLRGRENPTCDCRELMKDLIPESHRDKY